MDSLPYSWTSLLTKFGLIASEDTNSLSMSNSSSLKSLPCFCQARNDIVELPHHFLSFVGVKIHRDTVLGFKKCRRKRRAWGYV